MNRETITHRYQYYRKLLNMPRKQLLKECGTGKKAFLKHIRTMFRKYERLYAQLQSEWLIEVDDERKLLELSRNGEVVDVMAFEEVQGLPAEEKTQIIEEWVDKNRELSS